MYIFLLPLLVMLIIKLIDLISLKLDNVIDSFSYQTCQKTIEIKVMGILKIKNFLISIYIKVIL